MAINRPAIRLIFFAVAATATALAQQLPAPAREIPLYPGVAPGSENWHYEERAAGTPAKPQAQNIVKPVLLYYPADKPSAVGTAMIVAPGGGFRTLMMSYEGVDVAKRLNQMGVDAFVLKYRTIYVAPAAPAGQISNGAVTANPQAWQNVRAMSDADGQQAVRLIRQHAAEYGVLPESDRHDWFLCRRRGFTLGRLWTRRWQA